MSSAAALLLFSAAACSAQTTTAQITGKVTDASGAVVPGAAVSVTNADTGVTRRVESNESGAYTVPLLHPGNYRASVEKAGFRPVTQSGIVLEVGRTAQLDFTLEIGAVTEAVEVIATAAALDQSTSSLGQVIDNSKIAGIPLNGRSPFRLVQLTPGVLSAPSANGQFGDIPVNTTWDANFSINGGRHQSNEVQIDGVPATAGFFNQMTTIPSVEATQEFKVESNNLAAEWGRFGGGVVNVSTRSGTNQWRGSAFEFLRNSALDANEFFNKRAGKNKPPFRMNQFGGALGGPVALGKLYNGRNRSFFFADYQGTRWRRGDVFLTTLPTQLERNGNFTQTLNTAAQRIVVYDPVTSRPDPPRAGQQIRDPFPGNVLPAARIDPVAPKIVAFYPQPNAPGDSVAHTNNFVSNAKRIISQNQLSARLDHNLSERLRFFGRFAGNNTNLTQPDYYGNVATPNPGAVGTTPFHQRSLAWDGTYTASSSLVLDVRYGFARWYQLRKTRSYGFDQTQLGLPASLVRQFQVPVFPSVSVEGYGALGGQSYFSNGNDTHTLLASAMKYSGRHNIKTGFDVRLRRLNYFEVGGGGASYSFTGAWTRGPDPNRFYADSGLGIASLLLGVAGSGSAPLNAGNSLQNWYYAGYVQDDIRLSNRLTLNLGLRYETESPYTERRNQLVWFDAALPNPASNPTFPNLSGALRFAGSGARCVYQWDKNNFAPRAGLAYSMARQTVFRAGLGLFYAPLEVAPNATGFVPSYGFTASTPMLASLDGLTPFRYLRDPFPEGLVQPTRNSLGPATYLGQGFNVWDPLAVGPYVWQWNADVQRELPWGVVADVAYSGSHGVKLARGRDLNFLDPRHLSLATGLQNMVDNPFYGKITVGALAQPRVQQRQLLLPYPQYTGVTVVNSTSGNSIYHSLQVKAQKRLTQGLSFLLAYTTGKLIEDMNSQFGPIGEQNNSAGIQNWHNLRLERAVSEMDVAQALSLSYVIDLPLGPQRKLLGGIRGAAGRLIGGWQLNGVFTRRTGFPLVMSAPIPGGGNRPNSTGKTARLAGSRPRGHQIEMWFDTAQFLLPPSYSLGNVGRTLPDVRSPSLTNLDFALVKNTAIAERLTLQFRAEYFNLTNTPHFWLPATGLGSLTFGRISSTTALPRVGQLALKLVF
jgi:hypothetical protein